MICPKCGKEVSNNDDFCMHCGATLKVEQEEEKFEYCTKCGFRVSTNTTFCPNCGATIEHHDDSLDLDIKKTEAKDDEDLKAFVGIGKYNYYKMKFKEVKVNKFSFNICAMLFGPFWCFYRRLYLVGLCYMAIEYLIDLLGYIIPWGPFGTISTIITIVIWIAFGFFGNFFYYKNYQKALKEVEGKEENARREYLNGCGNPSGALILIPFVIAIVYGTIVEAIWPTNVDEIFNFDNAMFFNLFLRSR